MSGIEYKKENDIINMGKAFKDAARILIIIGGILGIFAVLILIGASERSNPQSLKDCTVTDTANRYSVVTKTWDEHVITDNCGTLKISMFDDINVETGKSYDFEVTGISNNPRIATAELSK